MVTVLPEKLTKDVSMIGMYWGDQPPVRVIVPTQAVTASLKVSTISAPAATSISFEDGEVLSRRGGVVSIISATTVRGYRWLEEQRSLRRGGWPPHGIPWRRP